MLQSLRNESQIRTVQHKGIMQVPINQERSATGQEFSHSPDIRYQCNALTDLAKAAGRAAGYLQSRNRREMIGDAERLLKQSPERAMLAATVLGLLAGVALRNGR